MTLGGRVPCPTFVAATHVPTPSPRTPKEQPLWSERFPNPSPRPLSFPSDPDCDQTGQRTIPQFLSLFPPAHKRLEGIREGWVHLLRPGQTR